MKSECLIYIIYANSYFDKIDIYIRMRITFKKWGDKTMGFVEWLKSNRNLKGSRKLLKFIKDNDIVLYSNSESYIYDKLDDNYATAELLNIFEKLYYEYN